MTATVINIVDHPRPIDLPSKAAEARGFGMAIKKATDTIIAAKEPFTKQELVLALLLLKPDSAP